MFVAMRRSIAGRRRRWKAVRTDQRGAQRRGGPMRRFLLRTKGIGGAATGEEVLGGLEGEKGGV